MWSVCQQLYQGSFRLHRHSSVIGRLMHRKRRLVSNTACMIKGHFCIRNMPIAKRVKNWILCNRGICLLVSGCGLLRGCFSIVNRSQCLSPAEPSPEITSDPNSEILSFTKKLSLLQKLKITFRFIFLCLLFSPVIILHTAAYLTGSSFLERLEVQYLIFVLQTAGPTFIKLGQWASTRRDLFSENFCKTLSRLHTRCDPHTWEETNHLLTESFGNGWDKHLLIPDHIPIGSGCVAQVYQGYLKSLPDASKPVTPAVEGAACDPTQGCVHIAIKVMHPGVVEAMDMDTRLMRSVASWVDYLYPDVHWIALKECVDEFSFTMQKQLDMELEAKNLSTFNTVMKDYESVKIPSPLYPFVTKTVLVETFEDGEHISEWLGEPGGHLQKTLARLGVNVLLDMMFVHNFVHGDLHPGNILVQNPSTDPKLVLIDCGLAISLKPKDFENLYKVFRAIVTGQGELVADLILNNQPCTTLEQFRQDMRNLVDDHMRIKLKLTEFQVSMLFGRLFNILIDHKVRIAPEYTTVMTSFMVIEGVARSLDPNMDILDYARPCILKRAKFAVQEELKQKSKSMLQRLLERVYFNVGI